MAQATHPQRILIIKPSSLGDVATALPMLCDLHDSNPTAMIDWLVHPTLAPVLAGHESIHTLVPFDRKKLAGWWYEPTAFKLFGRLLQLLRNNRYDIVIDAQGLFRSGFLARVTGAKIRIGFADARELAPMFYTHKVALPDHGKKMLAVDRMRALLSPLNIDTSRPAQFRMSLPLLGLTTTFPATDYVVVIPGARWTTKRWPLERYTKLVEGLLSQGEHVLLLGSADEKPLCDEIATNVKSRPATDFARLHNHAGGTTLSEMIGSLSRAKLVIGNDSGPLHVAVALGRRTLSLYGPTDPQFVGPYGQLDHVIRHDVPCFPCRNRECSHHSCMNGVPVELVWEKTKLLLSASKIAAKIPESSCPR